MPEQRFEKWLQELLEEFITTFSQENFGKKFQDISGRSRMVFEATPWRISRGMKNWPINLWINSGMNFLMNSRSKFRKNSRQKFWKNPQKSLEKYSEAVLKKNINEKPFLKSLRNFSKNFRRLLNNVVEKSFWRISVAREFPRISS